MNSQEVKNNMWKLFLGVLAALVIGGSVYGIYKLVDGQTTGANWCVPIDTQLTHTDRARNFTLDGKVCDVSIGENCIFHCGHLSKKSSSYFGINAALVCKEVDGLHV
eukprot:422175_1